MRTSAPTLALALALATALSARGPATQVPVSGALPGPLHVGALVDLDAFLAQFPELAAEGFLAEQLDELVARGVPDPREELHTLALGTQLGKPKGVTEGLALGTSDELLLPDIRALAEKEGVTLTPSTYRGTHFLTGTFGGYTSRFADLHEGLVAVGYDQAGAYAATHAAVDTLQGRVKSYRETHGEDLKPGTYLLARMQLSAAVRRDLEDTPLKEMAHLTGAEAALTQAGAKVSLRVRASATSTLKAIVALQLLGNKLRQLADETDDPAVRRLLLEQTTLGRSGATLKIDTLSPRSDFVVGILALQELLRR